MKNNTISKKSKNDELELNGAEVFATDAKIDGAMTDAEAFALDAKFETVTGAGETGETFTYPEIVAKLETGAPLHEIERLMAATAIHDWLRLKEARKIGGNKSDKTNVGRKPDAEPSAHALYQRKWRAKKFR